VDGNGDDRTRAPDGGAEAEVKYGTLPLTP
jgi:hypothetical protein